MQFIDLKAQYQQIKTDVHARIDQVLNHGQYIMGPEVYELEQQLANYVGASHCIGVASGTDALLIALMALGVGAGDEVITTPFTFIAVTEVIQLLGAEPVFVDIDPRTYNIDPNHIEAAVSNKTKAIIAVDLYGQCAEYDAINAIAEKHGFAVIEDAAQSFGASYHGRKAGSLTTIACTSFFPSKPLGCYGDGGACFTNDEQLAQAMKLIRVHGAAKRYHHTLLGVNGRLDTLQAAILLEKFAVFPDELAQRQIVAQMYAEKLADVITPPFIADHNVSNYGQYTVRVKERDAIQAALKTAGIPTAVHYPKPIHEQPLFSGFKARFALPHASKAAQEVISLPFHPYLTEIQVEQICSALTEAQVTTAAV